MYKYIYTYIYIERERDERGREGERERESMHCGRGFLRKRSKEQRSKWKEYKIRV